jgi:hypothetical protein
VSGGSAGTGVCAVHDLEATGSLGWRIGEGEWPRRGFVVTVPRRGVRVCENTRPHAGHPLDLRPHRSLTAERDFIVRASHGRCSFQARRCASPVLASDEAFDPST